MSYVQEESIFFIAMKRIIRRTGAGRTGGGRTGAGRTGGGRTGAGRTGGVRSCNNRK